MHTWPWLPLPFYFILAPYPGLATLTGFWSIFLAYFRSGNPVHVYPLLERLPTPLLLTLCLANIKLKCTSETFFEHLTQNHSIMPFHSQWESPVLFPLSLYHLWLLLGSFVYLFNVWFPKQPASSLRDLGCLVHEGTWYIVEHVIDPQ